MSKFYFNKKKLNLKEPDELSKIKRKLNIHIYTNERFLKKFGVEMLKFLGQLNSTNDSVSYNKVLETIKRTDTPSFGRKIKKYKLL